MKKNFILFSLITTPLLIIGCGGSSSSTATTAKVSGTVPGTLIEAFCEDGTYLKVTSTQNGTDEHPFELDLPTNTNCRLVMTTNENDPLNRIITRIGFINTSAVGSTLTLSTDINLGHIPLSLNYAEVDDNDGDHVVDTLLHIELSSTDAGVNDTPVSDSDHDGTVDAYEDDDDDNIVNAYEDDDNDGNPNIHDDDDDDDDNDSDDNSDENNDNDSDDSNEDSNDDDSEEDSDDDSDDDSEEDSDDDK